MNGAYPSRRRQNSLIRYVQLAQHHIGRMEDARAVRKNGQVSWEGQDLIPLRMRKEAFKTIGPGGQSVSGTRRISGSTEYDKESGCKKTLSGRPVISRRPERVPEISFI